jgi:hypothetical protein
MPIALLYAALSLLTIFVLEKYVKIKSPFVRSIIENLSVAFAFVFIEKLSPIAPFYIILISIGFAAIYNVTYCLIHKLPIKFIYAQGEWPSCIQFLDICYGLRLALLILGI